MTRIERMKGQRQRLSLWAWRERLCAETPPMQLPLAFFMSFVPFLFLPLGF
jgi:hypothetical protein